MTEAQRKPVEENGVLYQVQTVTGVPVNRDLGLSRKDRRRIQAALHRQRVDEGKDARLRGKLAYVHTLNPEQARALRQ